HHSLPSLPPRRSSDLGAWLPRACWASGCLLDQSPQLLGEMSNNEANHAAEQGSRLNCPQGVVKGVLACRAVRSRAQGIRMHRARSEEHTSELQSPDHL